MRNTIIIISFFFFLSLELPAQETSVKVKVIGSSQNTIKYTSNLDESYFLNIDQADASIIKNITTDYNITFTHKSEIFFQIQINNERNVVIAITPGDTITIFFERDSAPNRQGVRNYRIWFEGSNAIAHRIYSDRFRPIARHFPSIDSAAEKTTESTSFFQGTENAIKRKLSVWDSLKTLKLISDGTYNLYYNDTKAAMYRFVLRRIWTQQNFSDSVTWISKYNTLKRQLFTLSGANDKYLLKTFVGKPLHEDFLSYKILSDSTIKDTLLKRIYERYFYLYDTLYRERAWGISVLSPALRNPYNVLEGDKTNAIVFAKYYPKSIYLKRLNSLYDSIDAVRKNFSTIQEINTLKVTSLKEIFNLYTNRFYFVDVWATWCAPCIGEFAYTSHLEYQLDSLNVKKIYLSIDEASDSTKWKDLIKKYYLNGSHYLVGREIQIDIIKRLLKKEEVGGLSIPQYFIYDKLNDKYYMNLSRPSSENILYQEIKKIIAN